MFDFDAGKLIIVGVVALLVIGPKDLPRVLRQVGQWTGKLRRMAGEFRGQFMDAMREADLDSIKREVAGVADGAKIHTHFDPISDIKREVDSAFDPKHADAAADPIGVTAPAATYMSPLATTGAVSGATAADASLPPPVHSTADITVPMVDLPPLAALPAVNGALPPLAEPMVDTSPSARGDKARPSVSRADSVADAARRRTTRANAAAAQALRRRPPGATDSRPDPLPASKPEG